MILKGIPGRSACGPGNLPRSHARSGSYNCCRIHKTLRATPAMESRLLIMCGKPASYWRRVGPLRFEVLSAFAMGIVLPLLATCLEFCRQGFTLSFADVRGDLQDYLSGGWASVRLRSFAPVLTVLAWAYFTSMMVDSSWGQIEDTLRGEARICDPGPQRLHAEFSAGY